MLVLLFALVATLSPAVPTRIQMGSADGCDRSLTDTFEIAPDGRVVWTAKYEPTRILALTTGERARLAHLERFDATRELPRDPDRRYSRVWFVIESAAGETRLRLDSARAREVADILFGAFERTLDDTLRP